MIMVSGSCQAVVAIVGVLAPRHCCGARWCAEWYTTMLCGIALARGVLPREMGALGETYGALLALLPIYYTLKWSESRSRGCGVDGQRMW